MFCCDSAHPVDYRPMPNLRGTFFPGGHMSGEQLSGRTTNLPVGLASYQVVGKSNDPCACRDNVVISSRG